MQVRTIVALSVSTLAFVIMACVALLLWTAQRSSYNHQIGSLAYEELGAYLRLSGQVFDTFNQVRRDLLREGRVLTFDLSAAKVSIEKTISEIRVLQTEELEKGFQTHDILLEISRLNEIASHLKAVFSDIGRATVLLDTGKVVEARTALDRSLGEHIDAEIDTLVSAAIADERGELTDALAEIEWVNRIALWSAAGAGIVGLVLTTLVIFTLASRLGTGFRHLETGAETFAKGELDHRIPLEGGNEFAVLAHGFNSMARQLREQRDALEQARNSLERRVEERTEELHAANAELKRHDSTRRQFFADIGHELRSPITAVRGEAEVALRARSSQEETYKSALSRIVSISDQLTRFVNDIFLIAREQAGVADLRRTSIDLRQPVQEAADQMRTVLAKHDASLTMNLPDDVAEIDGDEQRLCQLVQVLLTNAVQHSQPGVSIDITLQGQADDWQLSVEDNGPGIPEDIAGHAFERFYRGPSLAKREHLRSTGLGLPIAKSITNAHGGRIWVNTSYEGGTAICLTLPISSEESDDVDRDAMAEPI